jgi:hypothetical protein
MSTNERPVRPRKNHVGAGGAKAIWIRNDQDARENDRGG